MEELLKFIDEFQDKIKTRDTQIVTYFENAEKFFESERMLSIMQAVFKDSKNRPQALSDIEKNLTPDELAKITKIYLANVSDLDADDFMLKTSKGDTVFWNVLRIGNQEAIHTMLNKKVNINLLNYEGRTALYDAWIQNNEELINLLLAQGADINAKDDEYGSLLNRNLNWRGMDNVAIMLLNRGAKVDIVNKDGWSALIYCLRSEKCSKDISNIQRLLDKGASVTAEDNEGNRPLTFAAMSSNIEGIKLLIKKGAKVNAASKKGYTALMSAAFEGNTDAISVLIKNGAEVNIADANGITPLMYAVYGKNSDKSLKAVKLLLANKAKINTVDKNGTTALMIAAERDHQTLVRVLLEKGASVTIANNNGYTAIHLASLSSCENALNLLVKFGGKLTNFAADEKSDLSIKSNYFIIMGPHEDEIKYCRKAFDYYLNLLNKSTLVTEKAEASIGASWYAILLKDIDRARLIIDEALRLEGKQSAENYGNRGHINIIKSNLEAALSDYKKFIQIMHDDPKAINDDPYAILNQDIVLMRKIYPDHISQFDSVISNLKK